MKVTQNKMKTQNNHTKPFQLYWDTHWQCPIMFDGIEWWIWESIIEEWCWIAIYGRTPDLDTRSVLLFEI